MKTVDVQVKFKYYMLFLKIVTRSMHIVSSITSKCDDCLCSNLTQDTNKMALKSTKRFDLIQNSHSSYILGFFSAHRIKPRSSLFARP